MFVVFFGKGTWKFFLLFLWCPFPLSFSESWEVWKPWSDPTLHIISRFLGNLQNHLNLHIIFSYVLNFRFYIFVLLKTLHTSYCRFTQFIIVLGEQESFARVRAVFYNKKEILPSLVSLTQSEYIWATLWKCSRKRSGDL